MKRNKSALYLLPTFYRQVSDAIIIMIVMGYMYGHCCLYQE